MFLGIGFPSSYVFRYWISFEILEYFRSDWG